MKSKWILEIFDNFTGQLSLSKTEIKGKPKQRYLILKLMKQ